MNRTLLAFVLLTGMMVCGIGCGGNENKAERPSAVDPAPPSPVVPGGGGDNSQSQ